MQHGFAEPCLGGLEQSIGSDDGVFYSLEGLVYCLAFGQADSKELPDKKEQKYAAY